MTNLHSLHGLCAAALRLWGPDSQARMCTEKCAELIVAIQRRSRDRISLDELADELAGVEIMVEQMRLIPGDAAVNRARGAMPRLRDRVKGST